MIEAILIAVVLVVQTFGTAYAAGAGNRAVLLDAFGNPLCITSGEHGDTGDAGHGGLKGCCALACTGVAAVGAPPAATAEPPAARLVGVLTGRTFSDLPAAPAFSLASPRAPPSV